VLMDAHDPDRRGGQAAARAGQWGQDAQTIEPLTAGSAEVNPPGRRSRPPDTRPSGES
jgi:hypothetical protein